MTYNVPSGMLNTTVPYHTMHKILVNVITGHFGDVTGHNQCSICRGGFYPHWLRMTIDPLTGGKGGGLIAPSPRTQPELWLMTKFARAE